MSIIHLLIACDQALAAVFTGLYVVRRCFCLVFPLQSRLRHCLCRVFPPQSQRRHCLCLVFPPHSRLRTLALPCGHQVAAEVFPTSAASLGLAVCNVTARIGGMFAPQVALLGAKTACLVFGLLALVSAVVAILVLPVCRTPGASRRRDCHFATPPLYPY